MLADTDSINFAGQRMTDSPERIAVGEDDEQEEPHWRELQVNDLVLDHPTRRMYEEHTKITWTQHGMRGLRQPLDLW